MTTHTKNYSLIYDPALAVHMRRLGVPFPAEAAIFLRQLAFWLSTRSGYWSHRGKRKWIYNGYKEWVRNQFTSLSASQFGRMIRALVSLGFIEKTTFAGIKQDLDEIAPVSWQEHNTKSWLTLCIDKIEERTGWRAPYPLHNHEDSTESAPEAPADDAQDDAETTFDKEQGLETLPSTVLQNRTSRFSDSHNSSFKAEEPSIYIENHLSHQRHEANNKENGNHSQSRNGSSKPDGEKQHHVQQQSSVSVEDNAPAGDSIVRKKRSNEQSHNSQARTQEVWEIAVDRPFPVFLNWRASKHYIPQGGKWENDAYGNAYAEFYKNRSKTTHVLFPLFMEEVKKITERIHQAQSNNMVEANSLPSWFIESLPEPTLDNVHQLMENLDIVIERGARVVLPTKATTPSSLTTSYQEAQETAQLKPLAPMNTPALPFYGEQPSEGVEEVLKRKQTQWKSAPILRGKIRAWVEDTPGVIMTDYGPELEASPVAEQSEPTSVAPSQTNSPPAQEPTDYAASENIVDDPWDTPNADEANPPDNHPQPTTEPTLTKPVAPKPVLIKVILAVWDNVYELGKLILDASEEALQEATQRLTPQQVARVKEAATKVWSPGVNRDAEYKGERVEIWEIGQSQTVKVRTKAGGGFMKVRRKDLRPWLGI